MAGILFPTDFSGHAAAAWPYAVGLARRGGAALHVLHVVAPPVIGASPEGAVFAPPTLIDGVVAEAQGVLDELAGSARALGVQVRAYTSIGDCASEILGCASAEHIGLIVMATTGRTGLAHVVMGSVTERVVRHAACPVLTVRHDPRAVPLPLTPGTLPRVRRLLVPLDGSDLAEAVLPDVIAITKRRGAELLLLRVAYARAPGAAPVAEAQAEAYLAGLAHRLAGEGLPVRPTVRYGFAPEEILDEIGRQRPDLVAMATHGHTGLTHLLLGSVAEKVLRSSPVPVLLFPARALRPDSARAAAGGERR
jgi:nucleotide-binding universal stress UspA family protein